MSNFETDPNNYAGPESTVDDTGAFRWVAHDDGSHSRVRIPRERPPTSETPDTTRWGQAAELQLPIAPADISDPTVSSAAYDYGEDKEGYPYADDMDDYPEDPATATATATTYGWADPGAPHKMDTRTFERTDYPSWIDDHRRGIGIAVGAAVVAVVASLTVPRLIGPGQASETTFGPRTPSVSTKHSHDKITGTTSPSTVSPGIDNNKKPSTSTTTTTPNPHNKITSPTQPTSPTTTRTLASHYVRHATIESPAKHISYDEDLTTIQGSIKTNFVSSYTFATASNEKLPAVIDYARHGSRSSPTEVDVKLPTTVTNLVYPVINTDSSLSGGNVDTISLPRPSIIEADDVMGCSVSASSKDIGCVALQTGEYSLEDAAIVHDETVFAAQVSSAEATGKYEIRDRELEKTESNYVQAFSSAIGNRYRGASIHASPSYKPQMSMYQSMKTLRSELGTLGVSISSVGFTRDEGRHLALRFNNSTGRRVTVVYPESASKAQVAAYNTFNGFKLPS